MKSGAALIRMTGAALVMSGLVTGAFAQDEERYACLQYDHVTAIHQLDLNHLLLETADGLTSYLMTVENRCFEGDVRNSVRIEGSGTDNCMRMTDRVHFGRRQCRIEDVALIESQEELDAALAALEE